MSLSTPDLPLDDVVAWRRRLHAHPELSFQEFETSDFLLRTLYTGRARLTGDFGTAGSIAPGFEASFVTLDTDLFTCDPDTIIDTEVTGTWIAGERVFPRASAWEGRTP